MKQKKIKIKELLVDKNFSIKETMRAIDKGGFGTAFVVDGQKRLFGVVTDGDIRRAILRGENIEKPIAKIANRKPIVLRGKISREDIQRIKKRKDVKVMVLGAPLKVPVVDEQGKIKEAVFIYADRESIVRPLEIGEKFKKESIKKVLVTGGAGYLGSVLCRQLLNRGYKVRVLDNLTYGDEGVKALYGNKNFELAKGDIRNISDLVAAINGTDAVIHLAAIVGDPACAVNPEETLKINLLATKTIAEICKYLQVNRFIFASTCSVYGQSPLPDEQLTEKSLLNPVSLYAETKIKCEQSILEAGDENFSPTILRMATLYGYSPLMRFDLAVNFLVAKALFDKKITIFGGQQWRPWLHLEDAAQAYISCLQSPIGEVREEVFNALSENYKVIEIGNIINSACRDIEVEINKKVTDKRDYNVSFDKISKALNYQPKKKISDGVAEIKKAIEKKLVGNYKDPQYRITLPQI
ncbi:MAG: NAD-dependent epimerase/dehydratase family protein [bacterium]